ncbi:DUF2867 domain-containing protein [Rhizobium binxianense]
MMTANSSLPASTSSWPAPASSQMPRYPRIEPVASPPASRLSSSFGRADFADAFSVDLPEEASGDAEVRARHVFEQQPEWITMLLGIRDRLVQPLGLKDTAGKSREGTAAGHRKQVGDPARGAEAIIKAVEAEHPRVHLLIGGDALDQLRKKLDEIRAETDAWEEVTCSTDFRE